MKELIYQVEFLSDIVLPATSNTEGNIQQLDFIAGSNFLGMVAREYSKFENRFDIFHSGRVKFGDAHILKDNKQTYKMPLSYFHEKEDREKKKIFNHHLIEDFGEHTQLKQLRNGYITQDKEILYIDYSYSQKSAYDKVHRRSKDSSMFGYSSMRKGSKWQFSIKIDETISPSDLALLKKTIIGKKRLGKSRSAQYGLVNIEYIGGETLASQKNGAKVPPPKSEIILYANSRISLVDECGNPSYDLKYLFDDLEEKNIDYPNCQIKTSSFTPYNGARKTKDYERICINKGSVILLRDIELEDIPSYVGAYQSDGFGEILVNPGFLMQKEFEFKTPNKKNDEDQKEIKSKLAKFLKQKEDGTLHKLKILDEVDDFIEINNSLYKKIKSSQWGKIRSICTSGEEDFKEEIREYISKGVKEWESNQIKTLLKDEYSLEFIKLISIQMPKATKKKEQKDEN